MPPFNFKEAVLRDPELGEDHWNDITAKARSNPLYIKALKEGLYSDAAAALGGINGAVWDQLLPATIGREMVKVVPTKNAIERFPKDLRAYAWEGEGPALDTGARTETQDVKANIEIKCKKTWTQSFIEDASWNVLQWQIEGIGKAIARLETEKIDAAYEAIAAADLAGGAEVTVTDGAPTWAQVTALIKQVQKENAYPNVIAMNPDEFGGLMALDQFISSLYLDPKQLKPGVIFHSTLNITFICSALVVSSLCIDTNLATALLVRRDLTTKPYEEAPDKYGVYGSERIGMGVLRTKAVARGTN
jgi:hypothetical protein